MKLIKTETGKHHNAIVPILNVRYMHFLSFISKTHVAALDKTRELNHSDQKQMIGFAYGKLNRTFLHGQGRIKGGKGIKSVV